MKREASLQRRFHQNWYFIIVSFTAVCQIPCNYLLALQVARNQHICYATVEDDLLAINKSPCQSYAILKGEQAHMETSLHSADIAVNNISSPLEIHGYTKRLKRERHHIHLPGPSYWPLLLSAAILVAVTGLLFIPITPGSLLLQYHLY